jgi:hypothetical protein
MTDVTFSESKQGQLADYYLAEMKPIVITPWKAP